MDQVNHLLKIKLAEYPALKQELTQALFGLERENLRVQENGQLATSFHPPSLGDKGSHPFITTDFSEVQPELITPPLPSIREMLGFLEALHEVLVSKMGDELIWPHSLPPTQRTLPVKVADFGIAGHEKTVYRNYLIEKYGEQRMLMCGIHFNFSFTDQMMQTLGGEEEKNKLYLKVLRNFIRYRWMLIWLYGCSPYVAEGPARPVDDREGNECGCKGGEQSASIRNSIAGYKNKHHLFFQYESLQEYLTTLQAHIDDHTLFSEAELYTPIRLKRNAQGSITHLEVRIFDLFPYNKINVSPESLYFTHLFLLFCLFEPEVAPRLSEQEDHIATQNSDHASCCGAFQFSLKHLDGSSADVQQELLKRFSKIETIAQQYSMSTVDPGYEQALAEAKHWISHPEERALMKLRADVQREGFMSFCLKKAKEYKAMAQLPQFAFPGYEDLELSTQLLLKAALAKGIHFELLDRSENFVRLSREGHDEYVVQASKTSLDQFSSILIMENKVVTKKVLNQASIRVPQGLEYHSKSIALAAFNQFQNRSLVIKPKSTNFGLGITIFKTPQFSESQFVQAINHAFDYDSGILIEEFITGKEYRFFVLNEQVVGILHRIPANVVGNGLQTIRELVAEKNKNPLRGKGYKTPLEYLQLGDSEQLFLESQSLTFDSIPPQGIQVFLRENSNISTGGDSIDFTDEVHPSYAALAVRAAKAVNVAITGLDMMIDNMHQAATPHNYAIIEMNFNPAIHIHCYPLIGKNRKINELILDALFPELPRGLHSNPS